jgi:hypothetical protein
MQVVRKAVVVVDIFENNFVHFYIWMILHRDNADDAVGSPPVEKHSDMIPNSHLKLHMHLLHVYKCKHICTAVIIIVLEENDI